MGHLYIVAQGPGKALKFIANLNELVDGDNIATEHCPEEGPTDKGRIASDEVGRLVAEMEKEEVLALLGWVDVGHGGCHLGSRQQRGQRRENGMKG